MKHFDVIVIGGGHAGCEAAAASARLSARTALLTFNKDDLGTMSCNPAIGGLGKGHLVREIDALDGIMAKAADYAGIQFRLLNRRKGPAVQGPRAQSDRSRYRHAIQNLLSSYKDLEIIFGEVVDFFGSDDEILGVVFSDGSVIQSKKVILTTGTFLNGVIHIGDKSESGGRMGAQASSLLANKIYGYDLPMGRLKTGTPPRLDGQTINWEQLEEQPGDEEPTFFSSLTKALSCEQVSCGITHTNARTHEIIRANLSRSAMYGGHIEGIGPRYCPSIEDKITRFADKNAHQIFLEPEGLNTSVIYPNGISTSLPQDVQDDYVRSIYGLENAKITQPGYAIEYDYVDPRCLDSDLSVRSVKNLYFAGQINGTTGYEEAAAQGLVAGLSAALSCSGKDPVVFSRRNSYIGVMIDDLVTRGVQEPYRMFTSRAEYRLSLRADNADQRLSPIGKEIGCISNERWEAFSNKMDKIEVLRNDLRSSSFSPNELNAQGINVAADGNRRSLYQVLSFPKVGFLDLVGLDKRLEHAEPEIYRQVERDALYANYIERQEKDAERLKKDEAIAIPKDFSYEKIEGLSAELAAKLNLIKPENIGQAQRIDGMTPAAILVILARLKVIERNARAGNA